MGFIYTVICDAYIETIKEVQLFPLISVMDTFQMQTIENNHLKYVIYL